MFASLLKEAASKTDRGTQCHRHVGRYVPQCAFLVKGGGEPPPKPIRHCVPPPFDKGGKSGGVTGGMMMI